MTSPQLWRGTAATGADERTPRGGPAVPGIPPAVPGIPPKLETPRGPFECDGGSAPSGAGGAPLGMLAERGAGAFGVRVKIGAAGAPLTVTPSADASGADLPGSGVVGITGPPEL
jgi:hypothetical protein